MRGIIILLYQDLILGGRLMAIAAAASAYVAAITAIVLSVAILASGATAFAANQTIPYLVNFQGRLTDNNGNVLGNGAYNVKFRLFTTATGGSAVWEEDHVYGASDNRVAVNNGLFDLQLGTATALSPSLFNQYTQGSLYLEVELPTPATATCASNGCAVWTEGAMSPRQPLSSSAYAFNSQTLDGQTADAFAQLSLGSAQTGTIHITGTIQSDGSLQGSSATITGGGLTLGTGTGSTGQISFANATNNDITILQSGSTGPPTLTLTLPSALGSSGDCLKDTTGGGLLGFSNCGATTTLQTAFNNTSAPATITTSTSSNALIVQSGTGADATEAFAVVPSGTATPTLTVNTTANQVGIGTATTTEALTVNGAVNIGNTTSSNAGTIRYNAGSFQGYDGASWLSLGSAATTNVVANQMSIVEKPSDQTVNNSAVLVNDSTLSFTIGANQTWDFHIFLAGNSAATPGFKFSITAPAASTCNWGARAESGASTANLGCGSATGKMVGAGLDDLYNLDGWVKTGATGGTVTLQWAQSTATASNTIVRAGSYLEAIQNSGGSLNPFVQGGDAFGATAVLGTTDANDLSVITNGNEAMHIDASGNIGLGGITSDGSKVELNGDLELNGMGAPAVAPTGEGRIYFDASTGHFRVSESGGTYQELLGVTGANASLSNLSSVAINADLLTPTVNSLDIGSAANPFASAYFGTGLTSPELTSPNNTDLGLQSAGSGSLNLTSGSGTINLAATTVRTTGQASLTYDLNSAINSTLYVENSNSGHVANLDVSGSLNLGSGQEISFGGTQISSSNMSDSSSLTKQGNSFNSTSELVQTDGSGNLPTLSGQNLTNLNASNIATGSGAVTLQSASSNGLTITSGSGTISLGSSILQRAGPALTLDLANAGASQLSITNSNGSNVANLSVTGGLTIGSGQVITVGSTAGTGASCSGGDLLQNQTVIGGVVTGGSCIAPGANTSLSNLSSVAADSDINPDSTAGNRNLGSAADLWANGYFGASLQSPSYTGTGAVSLTSGGTGDLTLDSASGNLVVGTSTTTLQKAANLFTIDLTYAGTSTLALTNSNGANTANLDVSGNANIGTGRVYSVGGTSGVSKTCTTGQILDGFTTTGGIITGGNCVNLAGDQLLGIWTSQQATTATNTQTTVQFTGAAGSSPSFNNGTHTLTLPSNASKLVISVKGGGGGGGATGATSANKAAGGGGEGGYSQLSILGSLASTYYLRVGGGGAGGVAGNNSGTTGNSSCFGTNAVNACTSPTASAVGGSGGIFSNASSSALGGAGGSSASGVGDIKQSGTPGCNSTGTTGTALQSGCGGGDGGAIGRTSAGTGNAGTTGGGGGGAYSLTTVSNAGGAGGDGFIQITVYIPAGGTGGGGSGTETLQDAYNLSTNPELTVNSTNGGLTIRDSSGGIGSNLLEVQDNTGSINYLAVTTAGISTSGSLSVASGQTYNVGSSTGQSSTVSCSAGQAVTGVTFTGGILTTAPTCTSVGSGSGANTSLSNLSSVAANSDINPDSTAGNRNLGSAADLWANGYFSTSLQAPLLSSASGADLQLQSAGSGSLGFTSGSGAVNLAANTIATAAQSSLTFDLNDAATSTLYVKNSNGSQVANLDVSGGFNIGSGQTYKVNGTQISTANLSDGGSITKQGNTFNGTSQLVQTDGSGNLPALSGINLTNLDPTQLITGTGAVTVQSASTTALTLTSGSGTITLGSATLQRASNALALDIATAGTSTLSVINSNGANVANLSVSGSLGIGSGGAYSVGATSGSGLTCSGGQYLQNQVVTGGIVTGGTCATTTSTDLQTAYDTSTSPATISLANGKDFDIVATAQTTPPNVIINLQCTTCTDGTGRFAIQQNGADVFTANPSGDLIVHPSVGQNVTMNLSSSSELAVNAVSAQSADTSLLDISNTGTSGAAANNANGLDINYNGAASSGAVEAAGLQINYSPGGTSGSTWNGLQIVAGAGAATGVSDYGLDLVGPSTSNGGTDTAIEVATGWNIGVDIQSGGLQLAAQADPTAPATNNLKVYASQSAGRTMLEVMGSHGRSYALQPSLFSNNVVMINASGGATAPNVIGTTLTSAASQTISHPTSTPTYGFMTNFASSATATYQAGTSMNGLQFMRGAATDDAGGFFFMDRLAFPDASYSQSGGTTGSRIFSGLSDHTLTQTISSDNAAGNRAGFSYVSNSTGRQDTDWMFTTKDGTTENLVDTGMPFTAGDAYDTYVYCPVQCTTIYWEIDNMTPGSTSVDTGSVTANLPAATTAMRGIEALMDLDATHVVRNLRSQRMYVESDR